MSLPGARNQPPKHTVTILSCDFPNGPPPIPTIEDAEVLHQVFRHRSYFARSAALFEDPENTPFPDNECLEFLGDSVLNLLTTSTIQSLYPRVRVGSSSKIRSLVVSNPNLASLSRLYKLPSRLNGAPGQIMSLRNSTSVQADLFEAYIGGVYQTKGLEAVSAWLNPILRIHADEAYRTIKAEYYGKTYIKQASQSPTPPSPVEDLPHDNEQHAQNATQDDAASIATSTTQVNSQTSISPTRNQSSPSQAESGHLSYFNQWCTQNSKTPDWHFLPVTGTRTTPIWHVELRMGTELFMGTGNTKKSAKNGAARQALETLGVE